MRHPHAGKACTRQYNYKEVEQFRRDISRLFYCLTFNAVITLIPGFH